MTGVSLFETMHMYIHNFTLKVVFSFLAYHTERKHVDALKTVNCMSLLTWNPESLQYNGIIILVTFYLAIFLSEQVTVV